MREARRAVSSTLVGLPDELSIYALPPAGDPAAWALASSVANDGLWYFDVEIDEVRLAPRTLELLGYQPNERPPERTEVADHVHARDLVILQRAVDDLIRGARSEVELEMRLLTRHGEQRWTLFRARALRGPSQAVRFIAGSLADIDEHKRATLQLQADSRRDSLTGLPNRVALQERLLARIGKEPAEQRPFAVLYADLDRFKFVNDTLGHSAGDDLLRETADRMSGVLGAQDMLARIGGDEFVILADAVRNPEQTRSLADAVQHAMRAPISLEGEEIFTAMSIGVRVIEGGDVEPDELLRDADIAMYEAKRQGGGRTVTFTNEMYATMVGRLKRQTEMHRV